MSAPRLATVRLVAAKELLEALRDRRTLFVALVLPVLLYPLMMVAMGPLIGRQRARLEQEVQPVLVTGPGRAALVAAVFAPSADAPDEEPPTLATVDGVADPADALARGDVALWIETGDGLADALDGDGSAELRVHRDSSDDASRVAYAKWERAVARATERSVARRLERHRLPPSLLEPFRVAEVLDAASAEQRAGYAFGRMLALVLVLMTLSSSFYPAVDVVAGEKERGTMETLLVAPCGRAELVLGKYLAVLAVTLTAAVLNLFSMWLTMGPLVGSLGVESIQGLSVDIGTVGGILALLLPLGALFSALSIGLSTLARSVKEAQHYLTPLFLLVMPLAMVVVVPNVELTPTLAALPITNVVLFFRDLMVGKLAIGSALLVLTTTVAAAALALWGTVRLFLREETLFRGPEGSGGLFVRPAPRPVPSAGAAVLLFTASLALIWYAQPLLPSKDLLANVLSTQLLVVLAPCLALAWWLRAAPRATFRLRAPRASVLLLAVPIGLTAPVVNGFVQRTLFGAVAEEGPFHKLAQAFEELIRNQHWTVLVAIVAVLPALCEEFVYRGFILASFGGGRDGRGRPGAAAVVGSAALFALFHIYPEKWLGTFLVGLVLGLLCVASRSLWPGVVAHALNNASLVLAAKLGEGSPLAALHDPAAPHNRLYVGVSAAVLAVSVGAVVGLHRRSREELDDPAGHG